MTGLSEGALSSLRKVSYPRSDRAAIAISLKLIAHKALYYRERPENSTRKAIRGWEVFVNTQTVKDFMAANERTTFDPNSMLTQLKFTGL